MKKVLPIGLVLIVAASLVFGCATTKEFTSSMSSKIKSFGSGVDEEIYAQVPEEQRQGVGCQRSCYP